MNDEPNKSPKEATIFAREIGAKAARKIKARKSTQNVWSNLGMMGLVGWSVVVPTLLQRSARHLVGQTSSRQTCLDAGANGGWAGAGLFECMVLEWPRKKEQCGTRWRKTMNNRFNFDARTGRGSSIGVRFSSAVFGGRFIRAFRPDARRFGSLAACCCGWVLLCLDFTCRARRLAAARGLLHRIHYRAINRAATERARPSNNDTTP